MDHPRYLDDLEDGLYGNEDALVESFKEGAELTAWKLLVSRNAVSDEHKIGLWLHSDSYEARQAEQALRL